MARPSDDVLGDYGYGLGDEPNISDDERKNESDFDENFDNAVALMMEQEKVEGLILLLVNNLNEKGKRILIGKLREALTLGNVQGGKSTLNVGILDRMIFDYVRELGFERAYMIAFEFYGELERKYMKGNGFTNFPKYFKVELPKKLTGLSSGFRTPPRKKFKTGESPSGESPYGGQIPGSDQILTPGEMGSPMDPRDPYTTKTDRNPDDVEKPFPEDVLGSSSNLCPSCVTGLCDTHIQLRF